MEQSDKISSPPPGEAKQVPQLGKGYAENKNREKKQRGSQL
jgi:hypothetical protein